MRIFLPPLLNSTDLAKANGSIADPIIVYRHRNGKMEVIGGFARYHHDQSLSVENTHVKVYPAGKKHPANWAADKARANKIKEGVATVTDIIRHIQHHGYTRNAARKLNLIPKLTTGEHPASRAAWLLMQHATKKELKNLLAGHITTREALSSIADKVDTLDLEQQGQATASFSIRPKLKARIEAATSNMLKSKESVELCSLPRVLSALGETGVGIYTRAETLHKLARKHNLSNEEILQTIEALDDPVLVIRESADSYIFVLPVEALNKAGKMAPVMAALRMQRETVSGHYLMSAYPLEKTQKIAEEIQRGHLVYSKETLI